MIDNVNRFEKTPTLADILIGKTIAKIEVRRYPNPKDYSTVGWSESYVEATPDEISFDAGVLRITFTDATFVYVGSSEWGSIGLNADQW